MPRICYDTKLKFNERAAAIIKKANEICVRYQRQGYDLTLRQLYYQFVAAVLIPNRDTEYKKLGKIINDARMAGLLDWDFIVDRTRNLKGIGHYTDPADRIKRAADNFYIDKWADQPTRVEVWIEKDALIGVLDRVCPGMDVDYFSCRGYTSASEMWSAAQRLRNYIKAGQRVVILHLGDHDPSGIDMTRDIRERLETFVLQDWLNEFTDEFAGDSGVKISEIWQHMDFNLTQPSGYPVEVPNGRKALEVKRIALTMGQVRRYNLPPNPAKVTDTRAKKYIREYGSDSWELDALPPNILADMIRNSIRAERDADLWGAAVAREEEGTELLRNAAERWQDITEFLNQAPESA